MNDITIIIKTFERKNMLIKLLKSIEEYFPNIPIIVVDDSKNNYYSAIRNKFKNMNLQYIVEDYNIGLSKGRNVLINNVKTKYFLLCDDDFVFDERTNIELALKLYNKYNLDILGGAVYNRIALDSLFSILWIIKDPRRLKKVLKKEEFVSVYNGKFEINNKEILLKANRAYTDFLNDEVYSTEICSNFFIGNTKKIKNIGGWTPELLKVGEHEFFFYKAKLNNLSIGYTPLFGVRHYPKKTFNYMKFRFRAEEYFKEACKEADLESFKVYDINRENYIYSYSKNEREK